MVRNLGFSKYFEVILGGDFLKNIEINDNKMSIDVRDIYI